MKTQEAPHSSTMPNDDSGIQSVSILGILPTHAFQKVWRTWITSCYSLWQGIPGNVVEKGTWDIYVIFGEHHILCHSHRTRDGLIPTIQSFPHSLRQVCPTSWICSHLSVPCVLNVFLLLQTWQENWKHIFSLREIALFRNFKKTAWCKLRIFQAPPNYISPYGDYVQKHVHSTHQLRHRHLWSMICKVTEVDADHRAKVQ